MTAPLRTTLTVLAVTLAAFAGSPAGAAGTPSATILAPGAEEIVSATSAVSIAYAGYSASAVNISGYLMLDGEAAGTFTIRVASPNGTTFDAHLDANGFASGSYQLSARVFTDRDNPVDTPAVPIGIDLPPVVEDTWHAYDLDARKLTIGVNVTDDHGDVLVRFATGANRSTNLVRGAFNVTLPAARPEGVYKAYVNATDGWNHTVRVAFDYAVLDREAALVVTEATYIIGGKLRISGSVSDPDGAPRLVVRTPLGDANLTADASGAWSVLLDVTPQLGTFAGNVTSADPWGGNTSAPFTFTVGGARETFLERRIATQTGAYADELRASVPRVLGGLVEICIDACNALTNGTVASPPEQAAVVVRVGNATSVCDAVGADRTCEFSTQLSTTPIEIAWAQGPSRMVTVRISGVRV